MTSGKAARAWSRMCSSGTAQGELSTSITRAHDSGWYLASIDIVNSTAHQVWRGGVEILLTPTEFRLLRFFLLNPGRVVSKAQILDHVWHYDFGGDTNILETYVSYLRRKLDRVGPPLIHTVRLVGYVLREPDR